MTSSDGSGDIPEHVQRLIDGLVERRDGAALERKISNAQVQDDIHCEQLFMHTYGPVAQLNFPLIQIEKNLLELAPLLKARHWDIFLAYCSSSDIYASSRQTRLNPPADLVELAYQPLRSAILGEWDTVKSIVTGIAQNNLLDAVREAHEVLSTAVLSNVHSSEHALPETPEVNSVELADCLGWDKDKLRYEIKKRRWVPSESMRVDSRNRERRSQRRRWRHADRDTLLLALNGIRDRLPERIWPKLRKKIWQSMTL